MYKLFESLNIVDIKSCTARMNETKQTSFIEKSLSSLNPGWGGGVLGLSFAGYVLLASQNPYPIIVYSVASYRPHLSHFWANAYCDFS